MLNFIQYISWVYADQEPESIFQFVREQSFKDIESYGDSIYGFEFEEFYYSHLFEYHPFSASTVFLEYHFEKYTGNKNDFLTFVKWSFFLLGKLKFEILEKFNEYNNNTLIKDVVFDWIEKKKKELETLPPEPKRGEIIKWNGTPSQFGYIFLLLVEKGFIEPPPYAGEWSYSGLAKQCYQCFHIESEPGKLTTLDNLKKEMNPSKNSLSNTTRAKFTNTIPNISDLA